jgi:predicted ATPase/DNA-binding CsgD family transcriptional regulator
VHGFPAGLTSFIGRAGPVREVAGLLGECRLVTVTGPGGSGKTRLAGEVAGRVAGRFADGVWLAELAPVRDGAQVPAVVAAALGVPDQPGVPAAEVLARVLARQQLLLVLDNCEHVLDAAAALCAGLLLTCDDVTILATSREPLTVAGEARYRLAPLALPDLEDLAAAARAEAVALFADRARSADAQFTLTGETTRAVARLVARLDGMPLAIELAAARVEALGVAQLLDRIDDRFALLTGGDRTAPSRHRSLAATVEWSYQLLDDDGRRVFRQVSVFPGPFTLEGAEAVAGPDAGPAVLHLVDCSLLVPPRAGPDGRSRYGMLDTLRAYGSARLAEAGEHEAAATALARYALSVAEQATAGLQTTTGELAAARRLDAEGATIGQVLAWAMDHDADMAVRLALALAPWWHCRGRLTGQYPVLQQAANHAVPGGDAWCAAQFWLGTAALHSGADLTRPLGHFTAIVDATGNQPPSRALAQGLACRSVTLANMGRQPEAAEEGRRALAMAREIGWPAGEALALQHLIIAAIIGDDKDTAVQLARQIQHIKGDLPGRLVRTSSYLQTVALGEAGDLAAARLISAQGLALSRDVGDLYSQVNLLAQMAVMDLQAGRPGDAAAPMREALQIVVGTGDGGFDVDFVLDWCGHLCFATGRYAEALTLWAAYAATLRLEGSAEIGLDARHRHEPLYAARQALGPAQARAADERGAAMSRPTALEFALMLTSDDLPPPVSATSRGQLSARERELVTLVAQGCTDAQIAAQLYISIRTVGSHLDRIRDKTGCRRRADLTRLALTTHLI